jgi:hypothetical protein
MSLTSRDDAITTSAGGAAVQVRAADVRPGQLVEGVLVLWVRPLPDHSEVCISLDVEPGNPQRFRWLRPDALITVQDSQIARPAG